MATAAPEVLERETVLATIDALLAGARAGAGSTLVVEGTAGLGKTRLLEEAAARAGQAGLAVARARGHELERDFAWGGCVQLLESGLAGLAVSQRAELLSGPGRPAAELLELRAAGAAPEVELSLLHAIAWALAGGERAPALLVVVDDAHWLDLPSLRAVHFLLGRLVGVGASLVLARRTGEPSGGDALLDGLTADARAVRTTLRPLTAETVGALVRRSRPGAGDALCAACARASRGNPLLLRQLLEELEVGGADPAPEVVERLAPRAVADAVRLRLGRLGPDAVALARAAAVLPDRSPLELVAAQAQLRPQEAVDAAAALVRADVLRDERDVGWVHPLIRQAVAHDSPGPARAHAHGRAAELLHLRGAGVEDIAAQLLLAAPGNAPWAVAALRLAATRAAQRAAPRSAVAYLERALEEPLDAVERAAVLVELGHAESAAGVSAGVHLHRALDAVEDPAERAQLLGVLGWSLHRAGRFTEATDAFGRGAALATSSEVRRELEAGQLVTALLTSDHEPAVLDQAASLAARPAGELSPTERLAVSGMLTVDLYGGLAHAPIRSRARALDVRAVIAAEGADVHTVWHLFGLLSWTDAGEVEQLLDAAFADARRRGSVLAFAMASYARSWPRWWRGALDDAAADAQAAIDAWAGGFEMYLPAAAYWLAVAHIERGDLGAATLAAGSVRRPEELDDAMRSFADATAGRLASARGDHADALAHQLRCAGLMEALGMRNPSVMPWASEAAVSAFLLGRHDQARELAADELARAEAFGAPRAHGVALRVHGLVTDDLEALEAAVQLLDTPFARLEHVRAQVTLGAALRRRGQRQRAQSELAVALDLAHRLGARRLEAQAREELVAAGGRPRRSARSGPDALTPSEQRVAALVATGSRNREVAATLFITVSTVEWHLKRIYAKLGITGRSDLPAALEGRRPQA